MSTLSLNYDDSFTAELPGDPVAQNFPRQVQHATYSDVAPTRVAAPELVAVSAEASALLDLDLDAVSEDDLAAVLSGNVVDEGMRPFASNYGGHQFGNWAGQLGDGRAMTLAEVVNGAGARWEMQLKGAGPTPYSRRGDGRAVMRSSVREFLCSEAMHHLGVPTTRALSLVATGDRVMRDMFYDGNAAYEPGAVVCRLSPSFIRFGSFEIHAARQDLDTLRKLTDYTLRHHYPELGAPGPDAYTAMFHEVCRRTAVMVAHWMRVGFVHGVMNTDNMSILGLTIDFGPYGWLEPFDPGWTPNTTDAGRKRYQFGNQPAVAEWNLARLGEALNLLIDDLDAIRGGLSIFEETFYATHSDLTFGKFGLVTPREGDAALTMDLFELLEQVETDYCVFFRELAKIPLHADASDEGLFAPLAPAYYDWEGLQSTPTHAATVEWLRRHAARVGDADAGDARVDLMNASNPKYVMRNWVAQLAIDDAEKGDYARVRELLDVMRSPYDEQPGREEYAVRRPEWARNRPGCSMLSCSS